MKIQNPTLLLFAASLVMLCSCGTAKDSASEINQSDLPESEQAPSTNAEAAAAPANWTNTAMLDGNHQFIRTAELKFKVTNITRSTIAIENIIRCQGGYVESSHLHSSVTEQQAIRVSADSTLETTYYTLNSVMTLRVPAQRLDSVLDQIATFIHFLDYRKVTSRDVYIDLMALRMTGDRYKKYAPLLTAQAVKDSSTNVLFSRTEQADNAAIDALRVNDKIQLSTIILDLYQSETVQREVVASHADIKGYRPPFWSRAAESFIDGFDIFLTIIVFLIKLWWLGLIGIIVVTATYYYNNHKRNAKKKKEESINK